MCQLLGVRKELGLGGAEAEQQHQCLCGAVRRGAASRGGRPVPPVGFRRSCVIAAVRHAPPRYLLLLCLVSHRCKWFSGKCHRNRSRARLGTTVGFLPGFGHRLLASHNQMSSEIPPAWPCARSQDEARRKFSFQ